MLLILFLENSFELLIAESFVICDSFFLKENLYRLDTLSKVNEGFICFFDWLREDESSIVGIRIYFFDDLGYNDCFEEIAYLRKDPEKGYLELMFNGNSYDPILFDDQDFTNNYLYKSQKSESLLTFCLDKLTDKELSELKKLCVSVSKNDLCLVI